MILQFPMDEITETLYWHLRVTVPHSKKPEILDLIKSLGSNYILAAEISDAGVEHFQAITAIPDRKELTKRLNEMDVPRGNRGRMCSRLRETLPQCIAYLLKDNNYEINGFNQEIISEAQAIYEAFSASRKSKTKLSKLDQIREIIKRDLKITKLDKNDIYVSSQDDGSEFICNEEFILDKVLEFYRDSKSLVREFYIISVVQTLCLEFVNYYPMMFRQRLLEKIKM